MNRLKVALYGFLALAVAAVGIHWVFLSGPRERMEFDEPHRTPRKSVTAETHMAVAGTPWATKAALEILEQGGNAFDAGMAALLALNVTYPEAVSFPSIAPTLIYDAAKDEIRSYCGVGTAPGRATIERFRSEGHETMPVLSILSQLLPASPDAIVSILESYGSMSFRQISPHEYRQGVVDLEESLYESVGADLEAMGYETQVVDDWHHEMGAVCAITRDPSTSGLIAGADPRQESWADGR